MSQTTDCGTSVEILIQRIIFFSAQIKLSILYVDVMYDLICFHEVIYLFFLEQQLLSNNCQNAN